MLIKQTKATLYLTVKYDGHLDLKRAHRILERLVNPDMLTDGGFDIEVAEYDFDIKTNHDLVEV